MNLSDLYTAQSAAVSHRKNPKIPLSAIVHAELPAKRELGAYQTTTNLAREELNLEKSIAEQEQALGEETLAFQKRQGDIATGISSIGTGIQGAWTLSQLSKMNQADKGALSGVGGVDYMGQVAAPLAAGAGVGYGVAKLTKSTPAGVAAGAATAIAMSEPARNFIIDTISSLF